MRIKTLKTCTFCAKEVYRVAGHGLCAACYYREKRNGTPAYVKVRKPCSIDGCGELSIAQSYCEMHYRRVKRTGAAESERYRKWGHVASHPLAHSYYWARQQAGVLFPAAWRDFWAFVADIGERPSPDHKLRKIDEAKPIGPDNFEWRAPKFEGARYSEDPSQYSKLTHAGRVKGRRARAVEKAYGISPDEYERMKLEQRNLCAICGMEERAKHGLTGTPRNLAVDHCHATGAVRELLCAQCNGGLGNFGDDIERLKAAIAYLEKHVLPTPTG